MTAPTTRALFLVLVASCGAGVQGHVPRCRPAAPHGSVTGTIPFAPVQLACAGREQSGEYTIVLASGGDACPAASPGADILGLRFCGPAAPVAGDYPVVAAAVLACPSGPTADAVVAGVARSAPTGGAITITDDEPDCVAGTFELQFSATEALTGEFEAVKW